MSKRIGSRKKKVFFMGVVVGAVFGMILTFAAANSVLGKKKSEMAEREALLTKANTELEAQLETKKTVEAAAKLSTEAADNWELVLINNEYPLDMNYVPDLTEIAAGYSVDARIAEDTKEMLADAAEAGLNMHIISAYRSYENQTQVFNETMNDWIYQGKTPLEAYEETKKSVAVPGCSEHASGLALDITSEENQALDDSQAETDEAKWLEANCYKYGFILRYPPEKADVTEIIYEPWHYRYVGKDAAKEIMEQGITLEEYLGVK